MATETAETRAAIERLRKFVSGVVKTYENERYLHDMCVVRDLYLAEHPADDAEPVTEEWLKSVGFTIKGKCYDDIACPPGESRWSLELDQFGALPVACDEHPFRNHCKTRGEIRRLCAALGIPLTATS